MPKWLRQVLYTIVAGCTVAFPIALATPGGQIAAGIIGAAGIGAASLVGIPFAPPTVPR